MGSVGKKIKAYITHPICNFHICTEKQPFNWQGGKIILAISLLQHFSGSGSILKAGVSLSPFFFFIMKFIVTVFSATVEAISIKWWFSFHQSHGTHFSCKQPAAIHTSQTEINWKRSPWEDGCSIQKKKKKSGVQKCCFWSGKAYISHWFRRLLITWCWSDSTSPVVNCIK